jgi:hypothetical protein
MDLRQQQTPVHLIHQRLPILHLCLRTILEVEPQQFCLRATKGIYELQVQHKVQELEQIYWESCCQRMSKVRDFRRRKIRVETFGPNAWKLLSAFSDLCTHPPQQWSRLVDVVEPENPQKKKKYLNNSLWLLDVVILDLGEPLSTSAYFGCNRHVSHWCTTLFLHCRTEAAEADWRGSWQSIGDSWAHMFKW